MASSVDNPHISKSKLILVYILIGFCTILILLVRAFAIVTLGMQSSKSLFSQLLNSLFRAPVSFYDCTPLGRILSRISPVGVLGKQLRNEHSISPIHWWILYLFHGVTWLLVLTSLIGEFFPRVQLRILSILAFLYAATFCFLALFA